MFKQKKDLILGKNALREAFAANIYIQKIYMSEGLLKEDSSEIFKLAKANQVPLFRVPKEKLDRMTKLPHQGVIALIDPVKFYELDDLVDHLFFRGLSPCLCILDGITDVRNFGAIARSAEVFGVDGLIIGQRNSAPVNEESIKASAGALLKIPVCREKNLVNTILSLKEMGFSIIGSEMKEGKPVRNIDFARPVVIVMGSEGEGISEKMLELCDEKVFIPQQGSVESLNVSVAAAILFYEWSLQNIRK